MISSVRLESLINFNDFRFRGGSTLVLTCPNIFTAPVLFAQVNLDMATENIRTLYKATVQYGKDRGSEFDQDQMEISKELKRRIKRLENDYNRLMKINTLLCEAKLPKTHFDENIGEISISHKGTTLSLKVERANPSTPVTLLDCTSVGAYSTEGLDDNEDSDVVGELQMEMERILEHYYNSAFRITKILQEITRRKNYHCHEITIVRNKLIEHPEAGSIYSFGYGSSGPIIKPMFFDQKEWSDAGLVHNTAALVKSVLNIFALEYAKKRN